MAVKLENLSDRPVLLTLATGDSLRLSPGEISAALADVVKASPKVEKLLAQRVIAVQASSEDTSQPGPGTST
jgi:hypothetical protein